MDYAVDVLLTAGMSSPALRWGKTTPHFFLSVFSFPGRKKQTAVSARSITRQGVDIEFAAYSEITAACVLLIPFEVLSVAHLAIHLEQWSVW